MGRETTSRPQSAQSSESSSDGRHFLLSPGSSKLAATLRMASGSLHSPSVPQGHRATVRTSSINSISGSIPGLMHTTSVSGSHVIPSPGSHHHDAPIGSPFGSQGGRLGRSKSHHHTDLVMSPGENPNGAGGSSTSNRTSGKSSVPTNYGNLHSNVVVDRENEGRYAGKGGMNRRTSQPMFVGEANMGGNISNTHFSEGLHCKSPETPEDSPPHTADQSFELPDSSGNYTAESTGRSTNGQSPHEMRNNSSLNTPKSSPSRVLQAIASSMKESMRASVPLIGRTKSSKTEASNSYQEPDAPENAADTRSNRNSLNSSLTKPLLREGNHKTPRERTPDPSHCSPTLGFRSSGPRGSIPQIPMHSPQEGHHSRIQVGQHGGKSATPTGAAGMSKSTLETLVESRRRLESSRALGRDSGSHSVSQSGYIPASAMSPPTSAMQIPSPGLQGDGNQTYPHEYPDSRKNSAVSSQGGDQSITVGRSSGRNMSITNAAGRESSGMRSSIISAATGMLSGLDKLDSLVGVRTPPPGCRTPRSPRSNQGDSPGFELQQSHSPKKNSSRSPRFASEDPIRSIDMGAGFRHPGVLSPSIAPASSASAGASQHPKSSDLSAVFARNMQNANIPGSTQSPGVNIASSTSPSMIRTHSIGARGVKQAPAISPEEDPAAATEMKSGIREGLALHTADLEPGSTEGLEGTEGQAKATADAADAASVGIAVTYGMINFVCLVPVCVAFTRIVFQHPMFDPYIPYLVKVMLLSCAIHQLVFSYCSTLPFAIGQVQDVGLIFLAAMVRSIVDLSTDFSAAGADGKIAGGAGKIGGSNNLIQLPELPAYNDIALADNFYLKNTNTGFDFYSGNAAENVFSTIPFSTGHADLYDAINLLQENTAASGGAAPAAYSPNEAAAIIARKYGVLKHPPEEIVATSLWACGIATVVTGFGVYMVGQRKLTDYVSLLPFPVVGGYLGYIGWFCLAAGLTIVSNIHIGDPSTLIPLFQQKLFLKLAVFAVLLTFIMWIHYKIAKYSVFIMPLALIIMPVAFMIVAFYGVGMDVDELRQGDWLPMPASEPIWGTKAWYLYDPTLVHWSMIPRQAFNMCGLFIVVTFGSSLDVAAIQAELPWKMDYNSEIKTVGRANILSGIFGGFTGSYIFSQTVFSLKSKVTSATCGLTVAVLQLIFYVIPVDPCSVLPNPYVASIVGLFGVDIMLDWLWRSRALVSRMEFGLIWLSFVLVMFFAGQSSFGVIEGMIASTVLAALLFAIAYARKPVYKIVENLDSTVFRKFTERVAVQENKNQIFCAALNGYIFFGSAMKITHDLPTDILGKEGVKYVILDFGLVDDVDSTAAVAMASTKIALKARGIQVTVSGIQNETIRRMLVNNGVLEDSEPDELGLLTLPSSNSGSESDSPNKEPEGNYNSGNGGMVDGGNAAETLLASEDQYNESILGGGPAHSVPQEFAMLDEALQYLEEVILDSVLPPSELRRRYLPSQKLSLVQILTDYFAYDTIKHNGSAAALGPHGSSEGLGGGFSGSMESLVGKYQPPNALGLLNSQMNSHSFGPALNQLQISNPNNLAIDTSTTTQLALQNSSSRTALLDSFNDVSPTFPTIDGQVTAFPAIHSPLEVFSPKTEGGGSSPAAENVKGSQKFQNQGQNQAAESNQSNHGNSSPERTGGLGAGSAVDGEGPEGDGSAVTVVVQPQDNGQSETEDWGVTDSPAASDDPNNAHGRKSSQRNSTDNNKTTVNTEGKRTNLTKSKNNKGRSNTETSEKHSEQKHLTESGGGGAKNSKNSKNSRNSRNSKNSKNQKPLKPLKRATISEESDVYKAGGAKGDQNDDENDENDDQTDRQTVNSNTSNEGGQTSNLRANELTFGANGSGNPINNPTNGNFNYGNNRASDYANYGEVKNRLALNSGMFGESPASTPDARKSYHSNDNSGTGVAGTLGNTTTMTNTTASVAAVAAGQIVPQNLATPLPAMLSQNSRNVTNNNVLFSNLQRTLPSSASLSNIRADSFVHNVKELASFAQYLWLPSGETLFKHNELANSVYFLALGTVRYSDWIPHSVVPSVGVNMEGGGQNIESLVNSVNTGNSNPSSNANNANIPDLSFYPLSRTSRQGAVLGNTGFFSSKLHMPYSFDAEAGRRGCGVYRYTRNTVRLLEREKPHLAIILQKVFLMECSGDVVKAMERGQR